MRFGQTLSTEPYHAAWGDVAKTQHVSLLLSNTGMSNALVIPITRANGVSLRQKAEEQQETAVPLHSPSETTNPA
ncbi:MAG: hypothetical protein CMM07_28540 [Rhodopirellula sp.]|nr:hypothetical protein [Rhodopirellula sp.]